MIRIKCPKCQKVLGLDESQAGLPASCPSCRQKFMVPGAKQPAGAGKPADKPAQDVWKKPGTEEDDFKPYTFKDEGPPKLVEDKQVDDMVKFATRQRQRERAWNQVGLPAKVLKIWTLVVLTSNILWFFYLMMVLILFWHKQRQGIDSPPLFPFNDIAAENFPALLVFAVGVGGFLFACAICGMILSGVEKMKTLESWGWALTACILSIVFMGMFGIAFGFWGILVLVDKNVKAEFYRKPGLAGMEQDEAEAAAEEEDEEDDYEDEDDEEDDYDDEGDE
jgi:DNA-directed RNA polymerase subunit RPC12/RpoP